MHINTIFGLTLPLLLAFINATGGSHVSNPNSMHLASQSANQNTPMGSDMNSIHKRGYETVKDSYAIQYMDEDSDSSSDSDSDAGSAQKLRKRSPISILHSKKGYEKKANKRYGQALKAEKNGRHRKARRKLKSAYHYKGDAAGRGKITNSDFKWNA